MSRTNLKNILNEIHKDKLNEGPWDSFKKGFKKQAGDTSAKDFIPRKSASRKGKKDSGAAGSFVDAFKKGWKKGKTKGYKNKRLMVKNRQNLDKAMKDAGLKRDSKKTLTSLANAVLHKIPKRETGDANPGLDLYNAYKAGTLYTDPTSASGNGGPDNYSKDVSWYKPDQVESLVQAYEKQDIKTYDALKKVSDLKKEMAENPKQPTAMDILRFGKSKPYVMSYIDYLNQEIASIEARHEMQLAMGQKEKKDSEFEGKSKEELYKIYPKAWVDEMDLDKQVDLDTRIEYYEEKISDAEQQLKSIGGSMDDLGKDEPEEIKALSF